LIADGDAITAKHTEEAAKAAQKIIDDFAKCQRAASSGKSETSP
jgi:hypothetical protein